jgi:outer membrane immunogenic protein
MTGSKYITAVAAISAILGTGTASAADLPVRSYSKAPAMVPVIYNWTGFYVGGNFGYSWGEANSDFTNTPTAAGGGGPTTRRSNSQNLNGALGGGQIGFNWQTNAFVWGLEADFQGTDQRKSLFTIDRNPADLIAAGFVPGQALVSSFDQRLKWFGTVRGRIGYLPDPRWLVYATGGFAYGRVDSNLTSIDPDGDAVRGRWSENRTGWVVGAGVEAALLDNWTWKLEYLHVDLGRNGSTNSPLVGLGGGLFLPAGTVVANLALNTRLTDEIVRLGVNYRFKY